MRNWKSFFSKEDFPIELGDLRAQEIVNRANQLLLEALSQAEPVFGRGPHGMAWYLTGAIGALDSDNLSKGRIVDIEDLSDEECEKHQAEEERIGIRKFEPWFDKYDLMMDTGETKSIVDFLASEKAKGHTKMPIRELNEGLRGGLRDGEVTFIAGEACLVDVLSVLTLTAFQHGHKVLRVIDAAMNYIAHDRFPKAIELYQFASFDIDTIETELPDFVKRTGATFVTIDRLNIERFFFKENRTADDFRKVMNAIKLAAQETNAHIVFSSDAVNIRSLAFEQLPIPVFELANNVIFFDQSSKKGAEHVIEIKKCSHEIPFGNFQSDFKCLKPSEWRTVLAQKKWSEIED